MSASSYFQKVLCSAPQFLPQINQPSDPVNPDIPEYRLIRLLFQYKIFPWNDRYGPWNCYMAPTSIPMQSFRGVQSSDRASASRSFPAPEASATAFCWTSLLLPVLHAKILFYTYFHCFLSLYGRNTYISHVLFHSPADTAGYI